VFDRLLLAIEGRADGTAQTPLAGAIARAFGAEVLVVHVHETAMTAAAMGERSAARAGLETRAAAESLVAGVVADLARRGLQAEGVVLSGRGGVGQRLLDLALDRQVGMVMVGPHVDGGWRTLLLGSTARTLIRRTRCPVLVVPRNGAPPSGGLLVLAAERAVGRRGLLAAATLARRLGRRLTVLALQEGLYADIAEAETLAELYAAAARGLGAGRVEGWVRPAVASSRGEVLAEAAAEAGAGLVVVPREVRGRRPAPGSWSVERVVEVGAAALVVP
jgi:nucleotide-binding universal stress UspA family protein